MYSCLIKAAATLAASALLSTFSALALAQGLPLQGSATASTQAGASRAASMAVDGNAATRWEASNSSPGGWLRINFASPQLIQTATLREYGNRILEHRVEYLDGNTWITLASGAGVGTALTHAFQQVTASAVRVLIVRTSGQPSLAELQVFAPIEVAERNFYPGCKMPAATQTITLTAPIIVGPGEQFNGGNARYNLISGGESSPPIFQVAEGGGVRNVIIGPQSADGIHCLGNCTINNVWLQDVAENAFSALGPNGTVMTVDCGATYKGVDNVFQHNGRGQLRISRFYSEYAPTLYRSCGECAANGGPRRVSINGLITRDVRTTVGINTNFGDVATIRNLKLDNSNATPTNVCRVHRGVVKGAGNSVILGTEWSTPNCDVSTSDVTLMFVSKAAPASCAGSCPF